MPDQIHIKDLFLRGIIGINPEEREKQQDILINITLDTDHTVPGRSDNIADSVNYRTISKEIIRLVEESQFYLVEKLASEISDICLRERAVSRARVTVEKPGALRFARSVGVTVDRSRQIEPLPENGKVTAQYE